MLTRGEVVQYNGLYHEAVTALTRLLVDGLAYRFTKDANVSYKDYHMTTKFIKKKKCNYNFVFYSVRHWFITLVIKKNEKRKNKNSSVEIYCLMPVPKQWQLVQVT